MLQLNLPLPLHFIKDSSGKSLTMLYTAYKLRRAEELNDPTIYLVVDRKDLKEQIDGTFMDC